MNPAKENEMERSETYKAIVRGLQNSLAGKIFPTDFDGWNSLYDEMATGVEAELAIEEDETERLRLIRRALVRQGVMLDRSLELAQAVDCALGTLRDDAWVRELVYMAAGAATQPLLEDHPDYVFPADRVVAAVGAVLKDYGIEADAVLGRCASRTAHLRRKYAEASRSVLAAEKSDEDVDEETQAAIDRLYDERESARCGESRFKEQRDAALSLLRWLIGDLVPVLPGDGD